MNNKKIRGIYNYDYLNLKINEYLKNNDLTISDLAKSINMIEKKLKKILEEQRTFYLRDMFLLKDILNIKQDELEKTFFNVINEKELLSNVTPLNNKEGGVINEK